MFYKEDVPAEGLTQFEAAVLKQLWDKQLDFCFVTTLTEET